MPSVEKPIRAYETALKGLDAIRCCDHDYSNVPFELMDSNGENRRNGVPV